MKIENARFCVPCSRCRQNFKFGDFTSSLYKVPQTYPLKCVSAARAARLFTLFYPMISLFCGVVVNIAVADLKVPNFAYSTEISQSNKAAHNWASISHKKHIS